MTERVETFDAVVATVASGQERPMLALLIAANLTYPFALDLFFEALTPAITGSPLGFLTAALALAVAFATPALGLLTVLRLGARATVNAGALRARRLAHFCVAAPPLYTATGVLLITFDLPGWDKVVWSTAWLSVLAVMLAWPTTQQTVMTSKPATLPAWLRLGHGLAAAAVLFGYVGLHLGNHLFALHGAVAHAEVQDVLRQWYRAPLVEPLLITLVIWLVGSGLVLANQRIARSRDTWSALQTASGAYLGAFLLSHVIAVLIMARAKFGIDTTWAWASGEPDGLLGDPWSIRLVPHYLFAVAAVALHAACGLRVVLLAHGAQRLLTNLAATILAAGGALLALALLAALLGFRL